MSDLHLRVEHREDGLLFYLSHEVRVVVQPEGRTRVSVQMWRGEDPDTLAAPDVGNLNSAGFRRRLAREGERKFGPVPALEEDLGKVATALGRGVEPGGEEGSEARTLGEMLRGSRVPSVLQRLVMFGERAELFRDPDGEPYATVRVGDHRETYRLRSKSFRLWLRHGFYLEEKAKIDSDEAITEAPRAQTLNDALAQLEATAIFEGPEHPVNVRIAEHGGVIFVDLGNERWEAVEIGPAGWRVVADPPVKFVRAKGVLPLPTPMRDGGAEKLRGLLNLGGDEDGWRLLLAWLVAAFRPGRPFPVLILQGEQGSAKSTAARALRALVDPSTAPLRTTPRNEHDLFIAATSSWVVAYDNVSHLPPWLSDAVCKLSTGGGFSTRTLYEDREQELFDAIRPVVLNGISDVATRPDLLDRSVIVTMPPIPEAKRRPEADLWQELEALSPAVLGFVFTAVSAALRNLPDTKLERLPRMADFALWVTAAEEALGWEKTSFMETYANNRGDANRQALEASPVAAALWTLIRREHEWNGTLTELLMDLGDVADEVTPQSKKWPSAPNVLSGELKRLAPALRAVGISAKDYREPTAQRRRMWRIVDIACEGIGPSKSSGPSEAGRTTCRTQGEPSDGSGTIPEGSERSSDDPHRGARPNGDPRNKRPVDSMDGSDAGPQLSREGENHDSAEGEA